MVRVAHGSFGPVEAALGCVAAVLLLLIGCMNRDPQYQVIPAVMRGDIKQVEVLLDDAQHVDIDWQAGGRGESALSTAASHDKVEIVKLLLARGANPNVATSNNETPLQAAAYHGNAEIVQLLLEAGASVDAAELLYGFTALASAARNGHVATIRILLEAGADPSKSIKDGRTPLELAKQYGHVAAEKELMSRRKSIA